MNAPALLSFLRSIFVTAALASGAVAPLPAAEPDTLPAVKPADTAPAESTTNAAATGPVEIRVTPQLIEQIRREIEQTSARNAEAITSSLNLIEPALARMQQRQAEALQGANRTVLVIAGLFAAIGFLALVIITLILVRALGRFSEMAVAGSPARREIPAAASPSAALDHGAPASPDGAVEQASSRFQGALEQLQRRIDELEHGLQGAGSDVSRGQIPAAARALPVQEGGATPLPPAPAPLAPLSEASRVAASAEQGESASRAAVLAGKGQTLLNLGEAREALACLEQALALQPSNPDTLVKKGLAYEQLEQWDEALDCYNRALAIDGSLTVAYLYKGGVCNRLHRYQEALASYEQALHAERRSHAS